MNGYAQELLSQLIIIVWL